MCKELGIDPAYNYVYKKLFNIRTGIPEKSLIIVEVTPEVEKGVDALAWE